MLDNLIRRDIFVDFPTVTNITFRYLNLSQWKKFEKKKITKNETKNTETTKESDFLPFLLHPLSIVVQTMQNLYYTRFKKKKKIATANSWSKLFFRWANRGEIGMEGKCLKSSYNSSAIIFRTSRTSRKKRRRRRTWLPRVSWRGDQG